MCNVAVVCKHFGSVAISLFGQKTVFSLGPWPCPHSKSLLSPCIGVFVLAPRVNPAPEQITPNPLLQGPKEIEQKGATIGPQ